MAQRGKRKDVGPWAKEKLASLGAYLNYYTKRLKNQSWCECTWFIDAFAGPGLLPIRARKRSSQSEQDPLFAAPDIEEAKEFVAGSPRVALEVPFGKYVFIEMDAERAKQLEELKAEFGNRDVEILQGDANTELKGILARRVNWTKNKGVVFLDPWGMDVPWSTIVAIAETKGLEIIINFPMAMAINRLLKTSGEIPKAWQDRLDATFGSTEWRSIAYEERTDLLGSTSMVKHPDAAQRLLDWFVGRLEAAFGHVSSPRLIQSTSGHPLYYLIWAGPHPAGLTGAEYILGKKKPARKAVK